MQFDFPNEWMLFLTILDYFRLFLSISDNLRIFQNIYDYF